MFSNNAWFMGFYGPKMREMGQMWPAGGRGGTFGVLRPPAPLGSQKYHLEQKQLFSNVAWFMGFNGPKMREMGKCGPGVGGGGKFGQQPLWGAKNVIWSKKELFSNNAWFMGFCGPKMREMGRMWTAGGGTFGVLRPPAPLGTQKCHLEQKNVSKQCVVYGI